MYIYIYSYIYIHIYIYIIIHIPPTALLACWPSHLVHIHGTQRTPPTLRSWSSCVALGFAQGAQGAQGATRLCQDGVELEAKCYKVVPQVVS